MPPYLPPRVPIGPGPDGHSAKKRSKVPVIAAAATVVALLVATVIVFATKNSGSSADPGPTTVTSESAPSFSTSTSASASAVLDAGLVRLLPDTYPPARCSAGPLTNTAAVAALSCGESTDTTNGPSISSFYRYRTLDVLRNDFKNVITNNKLAKATADCPGLGYRNYHYDSTPTVVAGQLASYIDSDGSATIAWTDEKNLELVIAQNFDKAKLPGMCKWWFDA